MIQQDSTRSPFARALRYFPVVIAVGALIFVLRGLKGSQLRDLFLSRGPLLLVILIPWGVTAALDSLGWKILINRIPRVVSFLRLLGVRLSAEAVLMSLPSGSLVSDSLTPHLLKTRCGLPVSEGLAAIAARKCLLALSQALYLGLAAFFGYSALRATSALTGMRAPERVLLGMAFFLLVGGVIAARLLASGTLARSTRSLLVKIPSTRLRAFLEAHKMSFESMDVHLTRVFHGDLRALVPPALSYTIAWIFEAFETFLILTLLGAGLRFSEVMPIESSLATIRVFAFFVPAGLGIQDIGYVLFLKALGVPDATSVGASFVLLKRAKETFWILVGYFLMARQPELKNP